MQTTRFLITGVGGQGTILASDVLAEVGLRLGYDAKKSDILGLAVRGGSVVSHIIWGGKVRAPITKMVEGRRTYIDQSLEVARQANIQLAKLKEESEALIAAANKEQGRIMREAMHERDKIIIEARKHAEAVAQKELDDVKQQIQQEKEEAIRDIRRQVAVLSVDIAEKIIRRNLDEKHEQMEMIDRMLDEMLAANH